MEPHWKITNRVLVNVLAVLLFLMPLATFIGLASDVIVRRKTNETDRIVFCATDSLPDLLGLSSNATE